MSEARSGRRRRRDKRPVETARPFKPQKRAYAPIDILSAEEEEMVHARSLQLLRDTGMRVLNAESREILKANACRVDEDAQMVYFDPDAVEHWLAKAPSAWEMPARNPANTLSIGDDHIHYGSASSAPNVLDLDRGRRPGTQQDFRDLVRLNHMLATCAFHTGHPVEPQDVPVNTRHLHSTFDWCTLSDKVFRVYGIGRTRVTDALAMCEIAYQIDRDELKRAPRIHTSFNVNSPLVADDPLLTAALEMARAGQAIVVSPVALSGAMSPITLSGSVIQCNAEAIAIIALMQMAAVGAPCFYGVLCAPVDMKSGAPAMGAPEAVTGALAHGQLARRYKLPQRTWLGSTAVTPDAQAAYESMLSLWAAQLAGAHFVYHAHGWMEGGLTTGFEKTILDAEMIGMMGALTPRIDFSDVDEAMAAIHAVGPGGHFLGSPHTMTRYETAFHPPMLSDWRPYEFWESAGSLRTDQRANAKWKAMLEAYEEPPIEPGVREALEAYVAHRTEEIGSSELD